MTEVQIFADYETRYVVIRLGDVDGTILEIDLTPDGAREFAYNLTRASIAIEEGATP